MHPDCLVQEAHAVLLGGGLFYPVVRAAEVLDLFSRRVETIPDEMTAAVAFLNFSPLPELPEPPARPVGRRGAGLLLRRPYGSG